jgi:phage tail sheath gpL-like
MLTLQYLRFSLRNRFASRYPRHKLANDGTRVGAGQAVITPKLGKAECLAWFREMEELGLVEGFDQFKNDLMVERSGSDANRMNFLVPPDLINQFIVGAANLQFRI